MPSCDDCDIPISRGKARKPEKLYQYIYDAYGMFHLTKYLVCDGDRQIPCGSKDVKTRRLLDQIDALHNQRESSIGIRDFDVPYSLNKSKLWQRVAEAKENIADMQDQYNGIRCTIYSQNKDTLWFSHQPASTKERLVEYHTIDENLDEVHKSTKPTCHVEFERPWVEKQRKKNELRKKKNKEILKTVLSNGKVEAATGPNFRLPFSHKPHILYREVNSEYSLSWANSQKRRSSKCYFDTRGKRIRKANEREIRGYDRTEEDCWKMPIWDMYDEDLYYCDYDEDIFYDDEYARLFRIYDEDADMCYFKRGPFWPDQKIDLFHSEEFHKIKRSNRRQPLAHDPDYDEWLQQVPTKFYGNSQDAMDFEEIPSEECSFSPSSTAPLPAFTVQIPRVKQFVNKRFFAQQRIQGLNPETYFLEVTKTNRNVVPIAVPSDFMGILCLQPIAESESMRCILNADLSSLYRSAVSSRFARYLNCQKVQDPLALEDREHSSQQEDDQQSSSSEWDILGCGICYAVDEKCLSLSCRHYFCHQCWVPYIIQCLNESRIPIECPEPCCQCVVDVYHMLPILPLEICKYYENRLIKEAKQNPSWLQCSQCQTIVDLRNVTPEDPRLVRCLCKRVFCASCKNEFHSPMDCRDATLYHSSSFAPGKTLNNQGFHVQVKQCGACNAYFEPSKCRVKSLTCFCNGRICHRCCKPVVTEKIPNIHYKHCVEKRQYVMCEDVPIYKSESIPQSVLIQCQIFCQQRSVLNLHAFKQYMDKLHMSLSTKARYIATFLTTSRLLECLYVKLYFLTKKLKGTSSDPRARQGKMFSHATHRNLYVRLRFLMSRIEAAYTGNQPQEDRLSYLVSALQKLMIEHKTVLGDASVNDIYYMSSYGHGSAVCMYY